MECEILRGWFLGMELELGLEPAIDMESELGSESEPSKFVTTEAGTRM